MHLRAFLVLREVAEYLAGQNLDVDVETVSLAQHFPRFADYFPFPMSPTRQFTSSRTQENFLSCRSIEEFEGVGTYSLCSRCICFRVNSLLMNNKIGTYCNSLCMIIGMYINSSVYYHTTTMCSYE